MELIASETSLVVAGSWNAAILTPTWMLRHGLDRPIGEASRVQVFLPAVQGAQFDFPRYALDQFAYVVRPDALLVTPNNENPDSFDAAEGASARVLRVLMHTPISGIGHNFEFRDAASTPEQVAIFTASR